MSVAEAWNLQVAIYAAIDAAVTPIPISDRPLADPPEIYVRLDGWHILPIETKNCSHARHTIFVHVFHRARGQGAHSTGMRRTKELQAQIYAALHNLRFAGALVTHRETDIDRAEDEKTTHGMSRYTVNI